MGKEVRHFVHSAIGTWVVGSMVSLVLLYPAIRAIIWILRLFLTVIYAVGGGAPSSFEPVF